MKSAQKRNLTDELNSKQAELSIVTLRNSFENNSYEEIQHFIEELNSKQPQKHLIVHLKQCLLCLETMSIMLTSVLILQFLRILSKNKKKQDKNASFKTYNKLSILMLCQINTILCDTPGTEEELTDLTFTKTLKDCMNPEIYSTLH